MCLDGMSRCIRNETYWANSAYIIWGAINISTLKDTVVVSLICDLQRRAGLRLVEVCLSPGEGGDDPPLGQAGHELRVEV